MPNTCCAGPSNAFQRSPRRRSSWRACSSRPATTPRRCRSPPRRCANILAIVICTRCAPPPTSSWGCSTRPPITGPRSSPPSPTRRIRTSGLPPCCNGWAMRRGPSTVCGGSSRSRAVRILTPSPASASRCPRTASTTRRSSCSRWSRRPVPTLGSAQGDLANALLAADRIEDAITGFSEALRVDPESAQAYCGLGLAYQRIQRWHEAAESFRTTELLAPDQAVGPYNLGLALAALGRIRAGAQRAAARRRARARRSGDPRGAAISAGAARGRRSPGHRAALRRRHQDLRAAGGARVPAPAEEDRLARGFVAARSGNRPAGARSGDQRVRARREASGRGARRPRNHHTHRAGLGAGAAAHWTTARARRRWARCCCASVPATARR